MKRENTSMVPPGMTASQLRENNICDGLIYGRGYINERRLNISQGYSFEHVPEILEHYRISEGEASNMVLQNQGEYSEEVVSKIIPQLVNFLEHYKVDNELDLWRGITNFKNILINFNKEAIPLNIDNEFNRVSTFIPLGSMHKRYVVPLCYALNEIGKTLRKELLQNVNTSIIENEFKSSLFPPIEYYTTWYRSNKMIIEQFGKNNPYEKILRLTGILYFQVVKYFPDEKIKQIKNYTKTEPQFLKDIFINEEGYTNALNALITVVPPIISHTKEYLLGPRSKGAISTWYDLLGTRGKIKSCPDAIAAKLLNKEFKGLDIYQDGSTLRKTNIKKNKYYNRLSKLI